MNNTKLFFISIGVIALLTGIPHISANLNYTANTKNEKISEVGDASNTLNTQEIEERDFPNESPFIGKWRASFDYEGSLGYMIVQITPKEEKMVGHVIAFEDDQGNSEAAKEFVLEFTKEKTWGWKALYTTEYENETYEIPCKVKLLNPSQLQLSYDYYGYSDIETWTKIK